MLYLATSPVPEVRALLDAGRIGLLCTPDGGSPPKPGWVWAADNGCFSGSWDADRWIAWLGRRAPHRASCLFATVPDVVADADATLDRWDLYVTQVTMLGYRPALVAQDGLEPAMVPWSELGALFIGGSTEWKRSEAPRRLAAEARGRGLHVHVGRVNSEARFRAWAPDADSADGTFLAFGPSTNVPKLLRWLERHAAAPSLWESRQPT